MAKRNFKAQRPVRKAKIKTNAKVNVKTKGAERVKTAAAVKSKITPKAKSKTNKPARKSSSAEKEVGDDNIKKNEASQWQLPPDYFDDLPPTHNAFIGYAQRDTLENVIAGIDVIRELATIDPNGLILNPDTCFGLLWFTQNLRNALRFEVEFRKRL